MGIITAYLLQSFQCLASGSEITNVYLEIRRIIIQVRFDPGILVIKPGACIICIVPCILPGLRENPYPETLDPFTFPVNFRMPFKQLLKPGILYDIYLTLPLL